MTWEHCILFFKWVKIILKWYHQPGRVCYRNIWRNIDDMHFSMFLLSRMCSVLRWLHYPLAFTLSSTGNVEGWQRLNMDERRMMCIFKLWGSYTWFWWIIMGKDGWKRSIYSAPWAILCCVFFFFFLRPKLIQSWNIHVCCFIFRTQVRRGSPEVTPQQTGAGHSHVSRTVKRYPSSTAPITSNALPSANGHNHRHAHTQQVAYSNGQPHASRNAVTPKG